MKQKQIFECNAITQIANNECSSGGFWITDIIGVIPDFSGYLKIIAYFIKNKNTAVPIYHKDGPIFKFVAVKTLITETQLLRKLVLTTVCSLCSLYKRFYPTASKRGLCFTSAYTYTPITSCIRLCPFFHAVSTW